MSEFKDKVDHYKQTIVDSGFKPDEPDDAPITDVPNINIDDSFHQETPQEAYQSDEQQQQEQKHKKTSRKTVEGLKKRIDQITFERNVREAQTQELLARVQEQERRLADQQALLEQNEQYKNAYYENNLQTREKAILNELKVAKEEGDIEKEINLSKELAKVAADQSTYGLYKSQLRNQPNPDAYNTPYRNQSYSNDNYGNQPYSNQQNIYPEPTYGANLKHPNNNYQEPVNETNEVYELWLEKNPWADPESRDYSPRLREEATSFANELDETLRYNGNSAFIGTPDYYKVIDNLMAERYAIKEQSSTFQEPSSRQPEPQYRNVAPVSRNGSSMADQYMTKNPNNTRKHIPLSEHEYKIARNLQIKMPNGSFSNDEALRRYYEAKKDAPAPHESQRLTID